MSYLFVDNQCQEEDLIGHSLTWSHDNPMATTQPSDTLWNISKPQDNKRFAKVWFPAIPTEADLLNLSTYNSDHSRTDEFT